MATRGENCNDWPRTVTGGCLLVAFAPDRATGNDDDDEFGSSGLCFVWFNLHLLGQERSLPVLEILEDLSVTNPLKPMFLSAQFA